jgi:hypothetical protein
VERTRRFTINREGIGFFKAILESYEEVALLTVLNGKAGEIEVIYPCHAEEVVTGIIEDMKRFDVVLKEEVGNV